MKTASRSLLLAAMMLFGMVFALAGSARAHVVQTVAGDLAILGTPNVVPSTTEPLMMASDSSRPNFNRPNFNRPNFNRPNFNRPNFNRVDFDRPFFNRPDFDDRPFFRPFFNRPFNRPFFRPFFFEDDINFEEDFDD